MKHLRHFSIRSVLGLGALIALLPLLAVATLIWLSSARLQRSAIQTSLQERAQAMASLAEQNVRDFAANLNVLRSAALNLDQPEMFRSGAASLLAFHRDWYAIALLDPEGTVLATVGRNANATIRVLAEAPHPNAAGSGFRIVSLNDHGRFIIGGLSPVRQGDRVAAWVVVTIPARSFLPALPDYFGAQGSIAALIDSQGIALAATDPSCVGKPWPRPPAQRPPRSDGLTVSHAVVAGQAVYSVIVHLKAAPWDLALALPVESVEAPLRLSRLLLVGLTGLLVLGGGLLLLLGEAIGRRIHALAAAADAIAHGTALPALTPTPLKEFDTVQAALVQAARLVRDRSATQERLHAMESNLKRLQQLESTGQLAAAIAHDFGSHLFVIRGRLQLIVAAVGDNTKLRELADPALQVAEKAVHLVRQLSSMAARQPGSTMRVNVNVVLHEMLTVLQHLAGPKVTIEPHLGKDLWDCRFDLTRLQSALVTLVTNARDASPGGGKLHIATYNQEVTEEGDPLSTTVAAGQYVCLTVADNGVGMSQETMDHLFEPFFTTKAEGNGIGLSALAVSVRAAGGIILVDSTPGVGSTFTILLPKMTEPESNGAASG